jgi:hypothetical protein
MSYFIAIKSDLAPEEWKAVTDARFTCLHEVRLELMTYYSKQFGFFKPMDADHDPGKTILRRRGPFTT